MRPIGTAASGTITTVGESAFIFFRISPNFVRDTRQRCHSAGFSSPSPSAEMEGPKLIATTFVHELARVLKALFGIGVPWVAE